MLSLPLAEASGLGAALNPEAWPEVTRRPPQRASAVGVAPEEMVFEGAPPECCAACQRPRAPVCLTKTTASYPRHVTRACLVNDAPYWSCQKRTPSTCNVQNTHMQSYQAAECSHLILKCFIHLHCPPKFSVNSPLFRLTIIHVNIL